MDLVTALTKRGFVSTMGHARRLIHLGGVRVDGGIVNKNIELTGNEKISLRKVREGADINKVTHNRGERDK